MDRWVLQPGSKMANYILLVCWTEIGRLLLFCEHIDIFCPIFFLTYERILFASCLLDMSIQTNKVLASNDRKMRRGDASKEHRLKFKITVHLQCFYNNFLNL